VSITVQKDMNSWFISGPFLHQDIVMFALFARLFGRKSKEIYVCSEKLDKKVKLNRFEMGFSFAKDAIIDLFY